MNRLLLRASVLLCLVLAACSQQEDETLSLFEHITTDDGLRDNDIRHILCLPDGSVAVTTAECVNLMRAGDDGSWSVRQILLSDEPQHRLDAYHGFYHVYADSSRRLWVKDMGRVWCVNMQTDRVEPLDGWLMDDFFIDSQLRIWTVNDSTIGSTTDVYAFDGSWGELQDMEADSLQLFLFFSTSIVACYDLDSHNLLYTSQPLDSAEAKFYDLTSLVKRSQDGRFYQLRCGKHRNIFLRFDPKTQVWDTVFETTKGSFHTLCIPSPELALMTCPEGLWEINLETGQMRLHSEMVTEQGDSLRTGFNAIDVGDDGHLWLGSYHDGLLHAPSLHASRTYIIYYIAALLALAALCIAFAFWFYATRMRRREQRLMNRLHGLIQASAQSEPENESLPNPEFLFSDMDAPRGVPTWKEADTDAFVARAIALVEQNLNTPGYNVEQLAADLCIERTGLYKKLTAMLDQTPTLFMRRIRMERAARLLREGRLSIAEIAEQTGFQSASYFSRLFQETYGQKPSEYAKQ
ncbi:MAG: AraC family transcriptional regulator [Bacteroidaceae bacterium]|nr:AraC family transcriptional regulator [Bacteroidaceae bacterium]